MITISSMSQINCPNLLSNTKVWSIYMITDLTTGGNEKQIFLKNNPTFAYAQLVLQPQTLSYGVYRIVFTMTTISTDLTKSSSQDETFIEITPSGLGVSSLKLSKPMYGGSIEITRGTNQSIPFNPYIFTYDIDNMAVISTLAFNYSCQLIDQEQSVQVGSTATTLDTCFNSSSKTLLFLRVFIIYLSKMYFFTSQKDDYTLYKSGNYATLTINAGSLKYLPNTSYEVYVSTFYMNKVYGQKVLINIVDDAPPVLFMELSISLIYYKNLVLS